MFNRVLVGLLGLALIFFLYAGGLYLILSAPYDSPTPERMPGEFQSYNPQKLIEASVLVRAEDGYGSGVCFRNGKQPFIWTAAHVVDGNHYVEEAFNQRGEFYRKVRYRDVTVSQEIIRGGRKAGSLDVLARVIRVSDAQDVALLLPYADFPRGSITFCEDVPFPGLPVWCVGSPRGERGCNSVCSGIVSMAGRLRSAGRPDEVFKPDVYDQIDVTVHPGNSGCGIFRRDDGRCLGLVIEFLGDTHTFGSVCTVPARRLREFCRKAKCEWAMDSSIPLPAQDDEPVYQDGLPVPKKAAGEVPKTAAPEVIGELPQELPAKDE